MALFVELFHVAFFSATTFLQLTLWFYFIPMTQPASLLTASYVHLALAAVTFAATMFIRAPYGKHASTAAKTAMSASPAPAPTQPTARSESGKKSPPVASPIPPIIGASSRTAKTQNANADDVACRPRLLWVRPQLGWMLQEMPTLVAWMLINVFVFSTVSAGDRSSSFPETPTSATTSPARLSPLHLHVETCRRATPPCPFTPSSAIWKTRAYRDFSWTDPSSHFELGAELVDGYLSFLEFLVFDALPNARRHLLSTLTFSSTGGGGIGPSFSIQDRLATLFTVFTAFGSFLLTRLFYIPSTAVLCYVIHYIHRTIIYPWFRNNSKTTVPLFVVLLANCYCSFNGYAMIASQWTGTTLDLSGASSSGTSFLTELPRPQPLEGIAPPRQANVVSTAVSSMAHDAFLAMATGDSHLQPFDAAGATTSASSEDGGSGATHFAVQSLLTSAAGLRVLGRAPNYMKEASHMQLASQSATGGWRVVPINLYMMTWTIGVFLFVMGMLTNILADSHLMALKAKSNGRYAVPYSGLYRMISCPNFFGEMIEWLGVAVIAVSEFGFEGGVFGSTGSCAAMAFALYTAANLVPRGVAHHQWYLEKFPKYKELGRKAVIPFLL